MIIMNDDDAIQQDGQRLKLWRSISEHEYKVPGEIFLWAYLWSNEIARFNDNLQDLKSISETMKPYFFENSENAERESFNFVALRIPEL